MTEPHVQISRRKLLGGIGSAVAVAAASPLLMASGEYSIMPMPVSTLITGSPEAVGMSRARLEDVFARLERRARDGNFPGAVALVARHGVIVGHRAFGVKQRGGDEPVTLDTIFDLESMTKVVATATSAMILVHDGAIRLHDRVADYLPHFAAGGKGQVTLRDMLRYSAGLPIDNQFLDTADREEVFRSMAETPLEYTPGTQVQYSDLTYRLLGRLVEVVAGVDLHAFARDRIWQPLGMADTMYTPPASLSPRIAATGYSERRGYVVRGEVQDEQDHALGGVVGCDGVFSTARDVAVFCQMLLNGGCYGGTRILGHKEVAKMTSNQTPFVPEDADASPLANLLFTAKGYGFELATSRFSHGGMFLPPGVAFGKVGGAGTFMWVDPTRQLIGVLLTNHGLPVPFDEPGWDRMLDAIGPAEFYDGIMRAALNL